LVTGLMHLCVHREIEHRMDGAAQRRSRFTLVKGKGARIGAPVDARGGEA
jgi:hypothetical protein